MHRRSRTLLVTLVAMVLAAGCGTSLSHVPLNPAPPPGLTPRGLGSVELIASGSPARPHVDVALIELVDYDGEDTGQLIRELRAYAGRIGCDAVVLGQKTVTRQSKVTAPPTGSSGHAGADGALVGLWAISVLARPSSRTDYTATCIVWTAPPAPVVVPVAPAPLAPAPAAPAPVAPAPAAAAPAGTGLQQATPQASAP